MDWIFTLLFFYKDNVGIKSPIKVDMLLNKETKPNLKMNSYSNPIIVYKL